MEEIVGVPISEGSNPEWGRTRYYIERIRDLFKSSWRTGRGDLRYECMRPGLLVVEVGRRVR